MTGPSYTGYAEGPLSGVNLKHLPGCPSGSLATSLTNILTH